ncbi:hypothetical protein AG1IA_06794 [Rhizoctonia solani AG-1 IA]|uniref:Uncharacterized protein n=1 Tax=Thanatephorus cucumeris (strain AG1-IA) TaxID=983506 RepID=L8WQW0_THACA|nr:hypothetical protein AG1IA_06794 [Rhizoctonia solani AG-1 IA]
MPEYYSLDRCSLLDRLQEKWQDFRMFRSRPPVISYTLLSESDIARAWSDHPVNSYVPIEHTDAGPMRWSLRVNGTLGVEYDGSCDVSPNTKTMLEENRGEGRLESGKFLTNRRGLVV